MPIRHSQEPSKEDLIEPMLSNHKPPNINNCNRKTKEEEDKESDYSYLQQLLAGSRTIYQK